ncbi:hypothetical protein R6Q59_007775, partial [Mikania micrantha]
PSSTCRDDYRRHHRRHRDIAPATLRRDIAPATRDDDDRLPTQRRLSIRSLSSSLASSLVVAWFCFWFFTIFPPGSTLLG